MSSDESGEPRQRKRQSYRDREAAPVYYRVELDEAGNVVKATPVGGGPRYRDVFRARAPLNGRP